MIELPEGTVALMDCDGEFWRPAETEGRWTVVEAGACSCPGCARGDSLEEIVEDYSPVLPLIAGDEIKST